MRRVALALTLSVLNACAAPGDVTIMSESVGPKLLTPCSRSAPHVDAFWKADAATVAEAETHLWQIVFLNPTIYQPRRYHRQYVGVVIGQSRLLYLNAFDLFGTTDFDSGEPIVGCDGGSNFFGVIYDPKARRFRDLAINGTV
jgi:hypothetical protein